MRLKKLASLTCVLLLAATASAVPVMLPPPGAQRVATADCVVIGKVTSIEAKTVLAARFPGDRDPRRALLGRRSCLQHPTAMGAGHPAAKGHSRLPSRSVVRPRRAST